MAIGIGSLTIKLGVNAHQMAAGLEEAANKVTRFADGVMSKINGMTGMASGLLAGFGLSLALPSIGGIIEKIGEREAAMSRLDAVVKATGMSAGFTAGELGKMSRELAAGTAFGATEMLQAMTRLSTMPGIGGDVFRGGIMAAMDLSAALGQDLQTAALQVGKALQNPAEGLAALKRAGIAFTASQNDMVASLMATGNTLEAQNVILDVLSSRVGGAAVADANTFAGQLRQVNREVGALAGMFGEALMPMLRTVVGGFKLAAEWALANKDKLADTVRVATEFTVAAAAISGALYLWGLRAKVTAAAQAVLLALSGPAGWAQLATGALIAAAAVAAIEVSFDNMASAADKAGAEAKKAVEAGSGGGSPGWADELDRKIGTLKSTNRTLEDKIATFGMSESERLVYDLTRQKVLTAALPKLEEERFYRLLQQADELERQAKATEELTRLGEAAAGPLEKYEASVTKIKRLVGEVGEEWADMFADTEKLMRKAHQDFLRGLGIEETPMDRFQEKIAQLQEAFDAKKISGEEFNLGAGSAFGALQKASGIGGETRLSKAMVEGSSEATNAILRHELGGQANTPTEILKQIRDLIAQHKAATERVGQEVRDADRPEVVRLGP